MRQRRLRLRHLDAGVPREPAPIDEFFDSVAINLEDDAIGIVLSRTGDNGALGLKAIWARGGLTLAQGADGSAPEHSDMPIAAIATGAVDGDLARHANAKSVWHSRGNFGCVLGPGPCIDGGLFSAEPRELVGREVGS